MNSVVIKTQANNLGTEIGEKFDKLFPSWPMMVATLIALALVILILFFLLYKPVKKAIKARRDFIQNNIDEARKTNDLSQNRLNEANKKLIQAHEEAKNLIKDARLQGEKVIISYTEKAKMESKRILDEAKLDIAQRQNALIEENKNYIAQAATELSRQILKKEVNPKTEAQIIDKFLKEKD